MAKRVHVSLAFAFLLCILSTGSIPIEKSGVATESKSVMQFSGASYTPHNPIVINGDSDFISQGWPGYGNSTDPYLISGLEIHTNDACISIRNVNSYFRITGCLLEGSGIHSGQGIYMENVSNAVVDNCHARVKQISVWINEAENCSLESNLFEQGDNGVIFHYSVNVSVAYNQISEIRSGGVWFYFVDNSTVIGNVVNGGGADGVWLYESTNCFVEDNDIHNSGFQAFFDEQYPNGRGVGCGNCFNISLHNNSIHSVRDVGIVIYGSPNSSISNNSVWDCGWYDLETGDQYLTISENVFEKGISFTGTSPNSWNHYLSGNTVNGKPLGYFRNLDSTITDITDYGQVILASCSDVVLENGSFTDISVAVQLGDCTNCTVKNLYVSSSFAGVTVYSSNGCSIINSTIIDSLRAGVYGFYADSTTVMKSRIISSNGYGIRLHRSPTGNLSDNTIANSREAGIQCINAPNSIIHRNSFTNDGLTVFYNYTQDIENNTVNGKPLGYYWGQSNGIIEDQEFGQLILGSCTNVVVRNCTTTNALVGVMMGECFNCSIKNSVITQSRKQGVWAWYSEKCKVLNSTLTDNMIYGVELHRSDFSEIVQNQILRSGSAGIGGWASYNCTVSKNIIAFGYYRGIDIDDLNECYIVENNISSNADHGIFIDIATDCVFQANNVSFNGYNGIDLEKAEGCMLIENLFGGNSVHSVCLDRYSTDNHVFGNIFETDCVDGGTNNRWDDQVSIGNAWWDYSGEGFRLVPGSAGSIDHYPTLADSIWPTISSPDDMVCEIGSIGNFIIWIVFDEHPGWYTLYRNSIEIHSDNWTSGEIGNELTGLSLGVYNFTIVLYDRAGNAVNDTVFVTIQDTTKPDVTSEPQPEIVPTLPLAISFVSIGIISAILFLAYRTRPKTSMYQDSPI